MGDPDARPDPLVSVVMATYNRSNILRYSIGSLQRSTLKDWELIVVGDACTDDTREVVEGMADARVRFVNLPENCGEQSGPNNEGVQRGRGKYVAFLNHDDLWLSNHLEVAVEALERHSCDMVFTSGLVLGPGLRPLLLVGPTSSSHYQPWMDVRASLWVFRREVAATVGPWRRAATIRRVPSQDWIQRAWERGIDIRHVPKLTALLLTSAVRERDYSRRLFAEHAQAFAALEDEGRYCSELLTAFTHEWASSSNDLRAAPFFVEGLKSVARRVFFLAGLRPPHPRFWWNHWRKGSFVRAARRRRGLDPRLPHD